MVLFVLGVADASLVDAISVAALATTIGGVAAVSGAGAPPPPPPLEAIAAPDPWGAELACGSGTSLESAGDESSPPSESAASQRSAPPPEAAGCTARAGSSAAWPPSASSRAGAVLRSVSSSEGPESSRSWASVTGTMVIGGMITMSSAVDGATDTSAGIVSSVPSVDSAEASAEPSSMAAKHAQVSAIPRRPPSVAPGGTRSSNNSTRGPTCERRFFTGVRSIGVAYLMAHVPRNPAKEGQTPRSLPEHGEIEVKLPRTVLGDLSNPSMGLATICSEARLRPAR